MTLYFYWFQGASQMVGPENNMLFSNSVDVSSLRTSVRIQSLEYRVDALEMRDLSLRARGETSGNRVVETPFPCDIQQPELLPPVCTPVKETSNGRTNTHMVWQCVATPSANETLRQQLGQCTDTRQRVEELEVTCVRSQQLQLLESRMLDRMASMETRIMSRMDNFERRLDSLENSLSALTMKVEQ